jgi:GNAT superfamily N-acetyltransferase
MEGLYKAPTIDQLVKFIEDDQVMFWSQLDVEIQYNAGETMLTTGIPHALYNGILRSQYTMRNANEQIGIVIEHFKARKVPFTWWISHRSSPKDLGEQLAKHGLLHIGVLPTMVGVISEAHTHIVPLENLTIREVEEEQDMSHWGRILAEAFNVPGDNIREYCAFFPKPGSSASLKHYIGIYQGEVVVAGTLFIHGEAGGLYNIAVTPRYRCRGIGTAFTKHLMAEAYHQKCKLVAMQSYPIVVEACQRLGFKHICDYHVYTSMLE